MFILRNISSCKSTIFHPHTIPDNVVDGSSRNLTPRHTTRDAFMNFNVVRFFSKPELETLLV